jgi:hypothetical protein
LNQTLPSHANELRALVFAALLFGLATGLGGLAAGVYGHWQGGGEGLLIALVAVAVCAFSGLAALFVFAWPRGGDGAWAGGMSAILIRSGLPMGAIIGVTLLGGEQLMRDWGLMIACIYLWFLVVETCLSVAIVSGSSSNRSGDRDLR